MSEVGTGDGRKLFISGVPLFTPKVSHQYLVLVRVLIPRKLTSQERELKLRLPLCNKTSPY
jgi:hypothetical protein